MTNRAGAAPGEDDLALVKSSMRRLSDYSNLAAAEVLQVSEATVRRWRAGSIAVPLRTSTRLALRSFLGGSGGGSERDQGTPAAPEEPSVEETGELKLFGSISRIRSYLAEIGPPGQAQERKLDVLDGIRTVITASSAVPDWWYRLRAEVDGNRL